MHWSDLQVFVAVARTGTVRAAAERLKVDASTVSRRIAALERGMSARLFERTASGLRLTAAGQAALQAGQKVEAELDDLSRRVVGRDARLEGNVRVTLPGSFTGFVHAALTSFLERHPAIEVELLTADAILDVDGRQADVAIRVMGEPPEHLVGRRVASLAGAVYGSRVYLEAHREPIDSGEHAWVDWDRRLGSKPAFVWLEARHPGRRIVARGLSTSDVAAAVLAGAGLGALPCLIGDREPTLVRLEDAPRESWSPVWLLTHRELGSAARVRAVVGHLAKALRERRGMIEGAAGHSGEAGGGRRKG
jgi:DNA-binding transcriptional LysR family regulator